MRCYVHTGQDAVGSCKNCSRGLCPQCLSDRGDGLACASRCEAQVDHLNLMAARQRTSTRSAALAGTGISLIFAGLGAWFLLSYEDQVGWFFVGLGICMFVMCALPLLRRGDTQRGT